MEEWGMWFRANEGRNGVCGLGDMLMEEWGMWFRRQC